MQNYPTFRALGNRAILLEWEPKIDEDILHKVLEAKNKFEKFHNKPILYINHTYNSLLINYGITIENINVEISYMKSVLSEDYSTVKTEIQHWEIPVCYDDKFALDLDEISEQKNLSKSQIISLHSEAIYTVFFIGFLPGFLYLGGLDSRLHFNRKSTPRLQIKKGAVGIGGQQTGIYPKVSPGGWNIIGNSPIDFFNLNNPQPCFAKAGDKVSFKPISLEEHQTISDKIATNEFKIESLMK